MPGCFKIKINNFLAKKVESNKPSEYKQMHCFPQGTSGLPAVEGTNKCTDLTLF